MAGECKTKIGHSNKNVLLFIAPQRIQKRRYQDLKNAATKRKLELVKEFRSGVTHIVTECDSRDQLLRCLQLGEENVEECEILTMTWFTESMKAGHAIPVQDKHRLHREENKEDYGCEATSSKEGTAPVAEWACQRVTCLEHFNSRFTTALETVQLHAELRDSDQDYSRALAFRRASCVLKSLPFTVTSMEQIKHLKDLGGHSKKIIQDILDDGHSSEVDQIRQDDWFQKMKTFTSVFGIGPSTAKKWIERGWTEINDARSAVNTFSDWRIKWGLAFHQDLITEVTRPEADQILRVVKEEVQHLCPGSIVELTGGFRRGKPKGHDVDILISHPDEGQEQGLLGRLLQRLEMLDMILCGNLEKSSFTDEAMQKDFKISVRGQLDHFEKWLGIIKTPKSWRNLTCSELLDVPSEGDGIKLGKRSSDTDVHFGAKRQKFTIHDEPAVEVADSERDWLARRVDLIIAPYSQYYYALVGWTGSKQFNRDLRLYSAKKLDRKLTSHGLFDQSKHVSIPASSEKEVFENLKLEYREPWERNC